MLKRLPVLALALAGCTFGPGNIQTRHSTDIQARKVRRIAVVTPETAQPAQKPKVPFTSGREAKNSEREISETLARQLYAAMAAAPGWQIVAESEVREVAGTVSTEGEAARLRRIGEMVFADAVLVGRVQRYRERVGDEWGAKSPASVAFVLELIDVRRGDIVWSARFDETQKPLSENIFALGEISQRGVRWLSAEQLLHEGVKKAVGQLHQLLVRTRA
ncbi:MAG TPA: hypothetical protein VNN77_18765 [candidate division Zixibacteria bacterium]|nr:hypothetical protein [candidate division Zixibacteria bacterium]